MADLERGFTFTTTAPDKTVTAAKLNALVDDAEILTSFYTDKTEKTASLAADDLFLVWDSVSMTFKKIKFVNAVPASALNGTTRGLVVQNNAGNPNFTLDVTCDEALLKTATGLVRLVSSLSVTANITNSGANGLDTGTEANSTWYYLWLISNGTTDASLLSASSTAPTLPGTYTYKALVGVVYNDGSGNFRSFYQRERQIWTGPQNLFTDILAVGAQVLQSVSGTSGKTVELTTLVPPTAKVVSGVIGGSSSSSYLAASVAANAAGIGQQDLVGSTTTIGVDGFLVAFPFRLPLMTPQDFFWQSGSNAANYYVRMMIGGYEL